MSSDLPQIATVAGAVGLSLGTAWWLRRRAARHGAPINVAGLMAGSGFVIFTKDECPACLATLERLTLFGLPIRQVREEDEAHELRNRGVTGVPITVVLDGNGRPCGQFAGLPKPRALRRAVRRAGRSSHMAGEIPGRDPREL